MICPHCSADLRGRERRGYRCGDCRRTFALEPRENRLHLHDLRVRKLAEMLADPLLPGAAPLHFTADQLRMAASRKALANPDGSSGWLGCATSISILGGVAAFAGMLVNSFRIFGAAVGVVAVVVAVCLVGHVATARQRRYPGEPVSSAAFERLLKRWVYVYGVLPPGLLPARPVVDVLPPGPPAAVRYCADPGTSVFLAASGIVERRRVALVVQDREWPPAPLLAALRADPELPVLVLHHADAAGCLTAPRLRAALPPGTRVVDAGLRPRVAERAGPPVRRPADRSLRAELARTGSLTAYERSWLAQGNTLPLASVRPARLLAAVERALSEVDPEAERAAALGFMAWPERVG